MNNIGINYLARDYKSFKDFIIGLGKDYFPSTNLDYSDSSPISLLVNMNAAVGDILSFYSDKVLKESYLSTSNDTTSLVLNAQAEGLKPRLNSAATTAVTIFQTLPSRFLDGEFKPDYRYALKITENAIFSSTANSTEFRTTEPVDFGSPIGREVTVLSYDQISGDPVDYILKKQVPVVSGNIKTVVRDFTTARPYDKVIIEEKNISGIIDVVDSSGQRWYEVGSLSQDTLLVPVPNVARFSTDLSQFREETPYLIKVERVPRRFVTRLNNNLHYELQFGSGIADNSNEELVPNQRDIKRTSSDFIRDLNIDIDAENFLRTDTYGLAPKNTSLTIRYITNSGVSENIPADTLTNIKELPIVIDEAGLDQDTLNRVRRSVAVNNPNPATGASSSSSKQVIQQNLLRSKSTQKRAVTKEDYIVRTLSLPERFGSIAKVYLMRDSQIIGNTRVSNPLALNLYILSNDINGNFTTVNTATKSNLQKYLESFRLVTDAVNLKDINIINIGVNFTISVDPRFNNDVKLFQSIDAIKTGLSNEEMQPGEPLILSKIRRKVESIEGIISLESFEFINKVGSASNYSDNKYDIDKAYLNGILYPAVTPSIFEVKFPNNDIVGRVVAPGSAGI